MSGAIFVLVSATVGAGVVLYIVDAAGLVITKDTDMLQDSVPTHGKKIAPHSCKMYYFSTN